ncbi:Beige/BEACH domain containing protein [Trichomonas vaginalis G3]|uniref:Beige/BEACH domain containing protein n=1 Tax=Trichomonas vaginalis (strain ATCC PRA-98 / G3) TaxID=412133 RepID=A2F5W8_TRIV3|nr:platelet formation protein family [Trichomonas vaginalis G3]EAX99693.1 Beige/BEACH domain containing protein [Trichomonas vaginalis G3]KAI5494128.1 platelet formation protein family [Trichomonas vaginalis G3]|eukprot:XP_001312623.1 Beige/BEACH domain containing protein [Trichomonas vaginalis G3]
MSLLKKTSDLFGSLGKRKSDDEGQKYAQEFKQMVNNLKKEGTPQECVFFFLEHLTRRPQEELKSYKLEKELTNLAIKYLPNVIKSISDLAVIGEAITFLNIAVKLFQPDAKLILLQLDLIVAIMNTDTVEILDLTSDFIHSFMEDKHFLSFMLNGDSLARIWDACFVLHENTNAFYGSVLLAAINSHEFKNYELIEPLINVSRQAILNCKLTPKTIPNALSFIGYSISKIDTGSYIDEILPTIVDLAPLLTSLQFFENFLRAPVQNKLIVWNTLNEIISNPKISSLSVKTALIAIHNANCFPPKTFSFVPFIRCVKDFPPGIQKMLFDVLLQVPRVVRAQFFCNVSPLKETQVSTLGLSTMVSQDKWDPYTEKMLQSFFLESKPAILHQYLKDDPYINIIASTLLDQLKSDSQVAVGLFGRFMAYAIEGTELVMPLIIKISQRIPPSSYMDSFIGFVDSGVPPCIYQGLISTVRKVDSFSSTFIRCGGCRALSKIVESTDGINFLSALACDGPYHEIDDFIQREFDNCNLSKQPNDVLTRLMMAVPTDTNYPGYIRIPSLCAHVDPVPIYSPYDMFIFGSTGPHFMKMEKNHLTQVVGRFISSQQVSTVCDDPELLTAATSTDIPHTSLYQFHPAARKSTAQAILTPSFSFWVYVADFLGKTIIATLGGEEAFKIGLEGISVFGQEPIEFSIKQWHLITLVSTDKLQYKTTFYIDDKQVHQVFRIYERITFGSETENNSIWYLSTTFPHSTNEFTMDDIKNNIKEGPTSPMHFDNININSGVKFVPYRGVVKYIHALGGPDFIFLRLLKCDQTETFLLYLQCAFNLLSLRVITRKDFFSSIRYILLQKPEMYTKQVETIIMFELASKEGLNWDSINSLFCDFGFLTSSIVSLNFVCQGLSESRLPLKALPLINYAIDSFVFFDLTETAEQNFFKLLESYIKVHPELLRKNILTIIALPYSNSDDIEGIYDEKRFQKQKKLLDILLANYKLFALNVSSTLAFTAISLLHSDLAVKIFHFVANIIAKVPNYYDKKDFKLIKQFIRNNVSRPSVWRSILTVLTSVRHKQIEDYLSEKIFRLDLYQTCLDFLCDLLPIDLANGAKSDSLSFKILHLLYSYAMTHQISFVSIAKTVSRLCTFGYDGRELTNLPFIAPSDDKTPHTVPVKSPRRRGFSWSDVRKSIGGESSKQTIYGPTITQELDSELYLKTLQYFSNMQFNDNLVEPPKYEPINPPEDFEKFLHSDVGNLVVVIAVKVLLEAANDYSLFKKSLPMITVFGSDVIPEIAVLMHRRIILSFVERLGGIALDPFNSFVEFLSFRVIEGWWEGHIEELFTQVLKHLSSKVKFAAQFVLACIGQKQSPENLILLASEFAQTDLCKSLSQDMEFLTCFLRLVVTKEVVEHELSLTLWLLLQNTLPQSSFTDALQRGKQMEWIENSQKEFFGLYLYILDAAKTNTQQLLQTRIALSKVSRQTKENQLNKTNLSQIAIIRRAMRYEFFYRLNKKSLDLDEAISRLYRAYAREKQIDQPSVKVQVANAPHPLSVPQKLVPLSFDYEVKCEKDPKASKLMPRSNHLINLNTEISELKIEQMAPMCLDGWAVPPFIPYGLAGLAEEYFNAKEKLFSCKLLNTTEPLPCVAAMNDKQITFILYASMTDGNLMMHENSQLLCHYALIESAVRGFNGQSQLFVNHPTLTFPFDTITVCVPRTYEYSDIALDVFTANGFSMTILLDETHRKYIMNQIKQTKKAIPALGPTFSAYLMQLQPENVAKMWSKHQLSTLDYLLYLNAKSGRSFNDFSQYPVFPWVISDYTSENQPSELRDLTKPMGMLSEPRAQKYREMYQETDPPYNYGTHYSYPAAVLHYMMRLEPFTLFNVMLHSGFDHRDRLFCDLYESYRGASGANQADIKELIPQFYVLPAMFTNPNGLPLKQRTDGHDLENVKLPPWARDADDFVWKMRSALESNQIRETIPDWIDLVWGYKSRGQNAVEANNVFHPLAYGFTNNPPTQSDLDVINNFGQCPQQIFTSPHIRSENIPTNLIIDGPTRTASIKTLKADNAHLYVMDGEVYALPNLAHKIEKLEFSVKERFFFVQGENPQYDDSLFDVSNTALSRDYTLLSVASESGFVLNYLINLTSSPHFSILSTCYIPGAAFKAVAVSTHIGIVTASTPTELFLFDLATGLMMKRVSIDERIIRISIDDNHGRIFTASSRKVCIYNTNLDLRVSHESPIAITTISVGQYFEWSDATMHVTGHVDGSVYAWICNKDNKFESKILMRAMNLPITSLSVICNGKAIIAADIEGDAAFCACTDIGPVIKAQCFSACALCTQPLVNGSVCKICGMPVCKECREARGLCSACSAKVGSSIEVPVSNDEQN